MMVVYIPISNTYIFICFTCIQRASCIQREHSVFCHDASLFWDLSYTPKEKDMVNRIFFFFFFVCVCLCEGHAVLSDDETYVDVFLIGIRERRLEAGRSQCASIIVFLLLLHCFQIFFFFCEARPSASSILFINTLTHFLVYINVTTRDIQIRIIGIS